VFGGFKPIRRLAWIFIKQFINQQFPAIETISTTQLADWLVGELPSPILIDARKLEEYAVSHLPGAHHLPTLTAVQQSEVSLEATIVVYCSVGYRSAKLVQELQKVGYAHVTNLEGSIFEWHNQGKPLVVDGESTRLVHSYSPIWGMLLDSKERSPQKRGKIVR
jgi:rhodanese-related sulfurtransferase